MQPERLIPALTSACCSSVGTNGSRLVTGENFALGRDITVEPLGPIGFFVNGEDIGDTGSGEGLRRAGVLLLVLLR